jgi:hypothetical protein
VLRNLVGSLDSLDGADRDRAERVLARPSDEAGGDLGVKYSVASIAHCSANFCVHWVPTTGDAPPAADSDTDGVPDQVELTTSVLEHAWSVVVDQSGYRAPLADLASPDHGPDGRLDVYLANIGPDGYYGFCTSDDPGSSSARQVSAYCVLDNDFSVLEYGAPPLESLQVTAAHEFFHAVQFAYDYWDEIWFMEGTAAWAEELVHDEVDDNHRYLPTSQLAKPWLPLDRTRDNARYGSWVFWQFLTEAFGSDGSPDPTVVREVLESAEGRTQGLDALATTTRSRGVPFAAVFGYFGVVNLVPEAFYEEGGSFGVSAPVTRSLTLTAARPAKAVKDVELDHLTHDYYGFRPGESLTGRRRLKVVVDLPDRSRGSVASLLVLRRDGSLATKPVPLDASGNGSAKVAFSRSSVRAVYVVLTNAGSRDNQPGTVRGRAL